MADLLGHWAGHVFFVDVVASIAVDFINKSNLLVTVRLCQPLDKVF